MMIQFKTPRGGGLIILPADRCVFTESGFVGCLVASVDGRDYTVRATFDQVSDALCHGGPFRDLSK